MFCKRKFEINLQTKVNVSFSVGYQTLKNKKMNYFYCISKIGTLIVLLFDINSTKLLQ